MATKSNTTKDFDPSELVSASKDHTEQLKAVSARLDKLEELVGDSNKLATSFAEAQKQNKNIDEAIVSVVQEYDKHHLIVKGTALLKWLGVLVVGGFIGWLLNKSLG